MDDMEILQKDITDLWSVQTEPLITIAEMLRDRMATPRSFGPSLKSNPKVVQQLSNALVVNGVRQNFLDGAPLSWQNSIGELMDWVRPRLLKLDGPQDKTYEHLLRLREHYFHSRKEEFLTDHELSEEIQDINFLLNPKVHVQPSGLRLISWVKLTQPQYHLVRLVDEITATMFELTLSAAAQGRLLAVENTDRGDRLLDYDTLARYVGKRRLPEGVSILPTELLGRSWLHKALLDRTARKKFEVETGRRFLEALYAWGTANAKRLPHEDAHRLAVEITSISNEAATGAWRAAELGEWKESGSIKNDMRISSRHIRDLINRGEIHWDPPDYFD